MKIRTGFVSNSSSSSFVIAVKKEDYLKAYEGMDDKVKALADKLATEKKAFGLDLVVFSSWCDNGGGSQLEYLEVEFNDELIPSRELYELNDKLDTELSKIEDSFTHSEDW